MARAKLALGLALLFSTTLVLGCHTKLKSGKCELTVKKGVEKDEGQSLLDYIDEKDWCDEGNRKSFQIAKDDDTFTFRMVVKEGKDEDKEFIELVKLIGAELRDKVFDGDDVVVELCDKSFKTLKSVDPAKKPKKVAKAAAIALTIPNSKMQISEPPNWTKKREGDWGLLASPDKKALLAFVAYSKPNESTKRLGQVATVLKASKIKWGASKRGQLGPDRLDARMAEGSATFGGKKGAIAYATVDSGTPVKVLVVYAVESDASAATSKQATAIIKTIRVAR